ncbi:MAG TPA: hypothetical protein VES67_25350 [Vicinamibacterales bacterium]|nr:hypothetical protein [Vicinamibacterales bacterium]
MKTACPREHEMHQAVAAGAVTQELRHHAAGCQACLATWLSSAVHAAPAAPPAIDPVLLWERARRQRRLRAEAQMSRILMGAQAAAAVLILAVLVFFATQSVTWTAVSFAGLNGTHLVAAVGLIFLAGFGLSRLITQDN